MTNLADVFTFVVHAAIHRLCIWHFKKMFCFQRSIYKARCHEMMEEQKYDVISGWVTLEFLARNNARNAELSFD